MKFNSAAFIRTMETHEVVKLCVSQSGYLLQVPEGSQLGAVGSDFTLHNFGVVIELIKANNGAHKCPPLAVLQKTVKAILQVLMANKSSQNVYNNARSLKLMYTLSYRKYSRKQEPRAAQFN